MARAFGAAARAIVAACAARPRTINELALIVGLSAPATRFVAWRLARAHHLRSIRLLAKRRDASTVVFAPGPVRLHKPQGQKRNAARRSFRARRITGEQIEALNMAFHIGSPLALPGVLRTVRALNLSLANPDIQRFVPEVGVACGLACEQRVLVQA